MVAKVLERALSSDNSLNKESEHREHSKTSILNLLDLEVGKGIRVVSKAQGVEGTTRVEAIKALRPFETATVITVTLDGTHEDVLDDQGSNDRMSVDNTGDSKVLDALIRENLGTSVEPLDVTSIGQRLGDNAAESTKHGPASVDQFNLTVLGKSLGISRETSGIPAVITGIFTSKVGNLRGKGTKELRAVGAVPGKGFRKIR